MARKSLQSEFEDNALGDIILRLRDGARESGVNLNANECALLLERLPALGKPPRWFRIAEFSYKYENETPGGTEAAIGAAMAEFGVARQTVFEARTLYSRARNIPNSL